MNTVQHRAFKDEVFQQLARVPKALSSPRRLELIDLLSQSARSVEDLAQLTGMSVANASQHLQVLRAALLVTVRRDGPKAYYAIADAAVFRAWQAMRDLGKRRFAELDRIVRSYLADRDQFETLTADELARRMRKNEVIVLDVRPVAEYRSGHIRGARSIPVRELQRRMAELPKDADVVAYCRGPYCVFADQALELLARRGRNVVRLEEGVAEWQRAGHPLAG